MEKLNPKNVRVAVVGPGAIGGLIACQLHRHGVQTKCVGTSSTVERIIREGLTLVSPHLGDYNCFPAAAERLDEPVDVTFLAVKGPYLEDACSRLVPGSLVVPLLNGLGVGACIRNIVDCRIATATIGKIEAFRKDDGTIHHTTPGGTIDICDRLLSPREKQILSSIVTVAGLEITFQASDEKVVWGKLSRLAPLSLVTAASGLPLGECLNSQRWSVALERCIQEVAAVASRDGFQIEWRQVLSQLHSLPASLRTSLQRDIETGKPDELSLITDGILLKGDDFGLHLQMVRELRSIILARAEKTSGEVL